VKVWNLDSGQLIHSLKGHTDSVTTVTLTLNGKYIVSGSRDNTIRIWNLVNGQLTKIWEEPTDTVNEVLMTPDGQYVVTGSGDNTIRIWELKTGNSYTLFGNDSPILSLALSPDARWLTCGDLMGRAWIFEWVRAKKRNQISER
jgi:WD40 repeat protein